MLERYFSVLDGRRAAGFRMCRSVAAELPPLAGLAESELWNAHHQLLGELRRREQTGELEETAPGQGQTDLLSLKREIAGRLLSSCRLCERRCGADRIGGDLGTCGVGAVPRVASDFLHLDEEPELVPSHTIFFAGCTFSCVYCQNWDIATDPTAGAEVEPAALAATIDDRFRHGSRNVNWVGGNPDPGLALVLDVLCSVRSNVPIVWNSNMYMSTESMALMDGLVDVFLGDFRYGNDACAERLSHVPGYSAVVRRNFARANEIADVMLRHLVLPGHLECCTKEIMRWVSRTIPGVYFNLMFQYRPCHQAFEAPGLDRRLTQEERLRAAELASKMGLRCR